MVLVSGAHQHWVAGDFGRVSCSDNKVERRRTRLIKSKHSTVNGRQARVLEKFDYDWATVNSDFDVRAYLVYNREGVVEICTTLVAQI